MKTNFKKKYATIAAVMMLLTVATAVTGCTSNVNANAKPKVSEKAGTKKQETKKQDTKKQDTKKQDTKKQDTKKQETNNKTNNTESTKTEKDN